jgi:predicted DNA-binding transcriptional regulator AlpA
MSLRALMELLASRPLLTRKDLAQRYGITLRAIDLRHSSGRLPPAVYLQGCRQPLWRPVEIIQWEKREHRRKNRS